MRGRLRKCLSHPPTLGRVPNGPNLIHGPTAQKLGDVAPQIEKDVTIKQCGWIHWKVDLISFPTSARTFQSESVWSHGGHHKLVLCCSPNPANASPFPFRSFPWFLIKTRVHMSPRSKHDGQELKKELTWWFSWWLSLRAQARARGPARGTSVGVDASFVLKSSSLSLVT
jgi:hypothetical protein